MPKCELILSGRTYATLEWLSPGHVSVTESKAAEKDGFLQRHTRSIGMTRVDNLK